MACHLERSMAGAWDRYVELPVPTMREVLLNKYIAWYKQTRESGISPKYVLKRIEQAQKGFNQPHRKLYFKVGTKLIRSYKGTKYEVLVVDAGFLYKGDIYKSLSAIAQLITGAHWNGKVFFGGSKYGRGT